MFLWAVPYLQTFTTVAHINTKFVRLVYDTLTTSHTFLRRKFYIINSRVITYICIQKSRNHIHQYINLCVIKPLTSINKASTINERYTLNHLSLLLVMVQEAWLTKYDIIRSGNVVHKAITAIDLAITYGQHRSRTISSSCYTQIVTWSTWFSNQILLEPIRYWLIDCTIDNWLIKWKLIQLWFKV